CRAAPPPLPAPDQRTPLPLRLVAGLLVAAAATAARSSLSEWHLYLHAVEAVVFVIELVGLRRPPFAGLPLRRKAAPDAAALRIGLPLRSRAVDDFLFVVDAHDQVAHHLIHHAQPAIELLHQLARSVDHLEHV